MDKEYILIIDDSKSINYALTDLVEKKCNTSVLSGYSFADCKRLIEEYKDKIVLSIADLNLPDCKEGDAAFYTVSHGIPTVVLTGNYDDSMRKKLYSRNITDYYLKENTYSLELVTNEIKRILSNRNTDILVCNGSDFYRENFLNLLKKQLFRTHFATNGEEALKKLKTNPDIKLILTESDLPKIDGLELTREVRKVHSKDEVAIIVLSDDTSKNRPAKFIKYGANDFIKRPFSNEEFFTRINSNIEILEMFQESRDRANKDYMTGMYNRRYFFDEGAGKYQEAQSKQEDIAIAMLDIDKFKNINDTCGHDVGDEAIREVAKVLSKNLNGLNTVITRFGGEEFCVILIGQKREKILEIFEVIRQDFENNQLTFGGISFSYTVSTGVFFPKTENLEKAVKGADECLYEAKETGRNKVVSKNGQ